MPRAKGIKYLPVSMSETAQEEVKEFASEQGYRSGAEYIRALIARDMEEKGRAVDFGLSGWGEGRNKKKTE